MWKKRKKEKSRGARVNFIRNVLSDLFPHVFCSSYGAVEAGVCKKKKNWKKWVTQWSLCRGQFQRSLVLFGTATADRLRFTVILRLGVDRETNKKCIFSTNRENELAQN